MTQFLVVPTSHNVLYFDLSFADFVLNDFPFDLHSSKILNLNYHYQIDLCYYYIFLFYLLFYVP